MTIVTYRNTYKCDLNIYTFSTWRQISRRGQIVYDQSNTKMSNLINGIKRAISPKSNTATKQDQSNHLTIPSP